MKEHRERISAVETLESNKTKFSEALAVLLQRQADDISLKPATRHYWKQIFTALLKSWPELGEKEIRNCSADQTHRTGECYPQDIGSEAHCDHLKAHHFGDSCVVNTKTGQTENEFVLPSGHPDRSHLQFRRVRMTKAGTFLAAHLDSNKVAEYDQTGKEIWRCAAHGPWAASQLDNGNTLMTCSPATVVEVNAKGEHVWSLNQNDIPEIKLFITTGSHPACQWQNPDQQVVSR